MACLSNESRPLPLPLDRSVAGAELGPAAELGPDADSVNADGRDRVARHGRLRGRADPVLVEEDEAIDARGTVEGDRKLIHGF